MKIYIVPGYSIPNNIFLDNTYKKYFSIVKEHIADDDVVIFCGGNTDMTPPFLRTEAGEMAKLWKRMFPMHKAEIFKETKSLSSLDNQIYAKDIIEKQGWNESPIIFCERTRVTRIQAIANKLYGKDIEIIPVDLYSDEQLKDLPLMEEKERIEMRICIKALNDKEYFKRLREQYAEKYRLLRAVKPEEREELLKELYKKLITSETTSDSPE